METLADDGYTRVEVRVTPSRTEIIIRATRTREVLREKGRRIREATYVLCRGIWLPREQRGALRRDGQEPCRLRDGTSRIPAIQMTSGGCEHGQTHGSVEPSSFST